MLSAVIVDCRESTARRNYLADAVDQTKQVCDMDTRKLAPSDSLQTSDTSRSGPRISDRQDGKAETLNGPSNIAWPASKSLCQFVNPQRPRFEPWKRVTAVESRLSDQLTQRPKYDALHCSRRAKASFAPKTPDFDREAKDPYSSHKCSGQYKRLFDPRTDISDHGAKLQTIPGNDTKLGSRLMYNPRSQSFPSRREESSEQPCSQELSTASSTSVPEPKSLLQPETRPISHDQLALEIKGIYAGLVMVEAKCIDIEPKGSLAAQKTDPSTFKLTKLDSEQWQALIALHKTLLHEHHDFFLASQHPSTFKLTKLDSEQWQALIALHKTLLHEHHDFFLASQHPSASPALHRLATKYSMPTRLWRRGIRALLEILRHQIPEILDHMLAFIYIVYSMMALLYETVPTFEDTWIECLEDLGRYRMAIEDDGIRHREVWSGVARFWYRKAIEKSPNIGRLYHHFAILARPYTLQRLSLYTRSLSYTSPFESVTESITTLLSTTSSRKESAYYSSFLMETTLIKPFGLLFTDRTFRKLPDFVQYLPSGSCNIYLERVPAKFTKQGAFAALSNASSIFDYAKFRASRSMIRSAADIMFATLSIAFKRVHDKTVYPLVQLYRVFLYGLIDADKAISLLERRVPRTKVATALKFLSKARAKRTKVLENQSPRSGEGNGQLLPEDFIMTGQLWSNFHFSNTWFLHSTASVRADIASEAKATSTHNPSYWPETAAYSSAVYGYNLRRKRGGNNWACYIALLSIFTGSILAIDHVSVLPSATETVSAQSLHFRLEPSTIAVSHVDEPPLPGTLNSRPEPLWIPPVTAHPSMVSASKSVPELLITSDSNSGDDSLEPHVTTISHWTFPILCITMLMICWQIAKIAQWEPIHVSGTLAMVAWWLWLYLKRDPAISSWYSWPIWAVGVVTLTAYSRCGFEDYKLSHSHAFLSLATAVPLAIAGARFVPDLRNDYLTALPPCFGISLSFYMFAVPVTISMWDTTTQYYNGIIGRLRVPWHSDDHDFPMGGRAAFTRRSRRSRQLEDELPRFRGRSLPAPNRSR
ncbi:hypothetical protein MMC27_006327 [Xylographa pallens]|nr:hypothetical protein [Xylographa pallens]